MPHPAEINQWYLEALMNTLVSFGVEDVCLAPGSRSTALAISAAKNDHLTKHVHFDERALGFLALGIAKGKGKPVAICTTSGTACGNLLPAIMEAHHDKIPLIIITADRPSELRFAGANQTTNQVNMYQNFVRASHDFVCPEEGLPLKSALQLFANSLHMAIRHPQGPVHCNIMQREPFFSKEEPFRQEIAACQWSSGVTYPSSELLTTWAHLLENQTGIILVGGNPGVSSECLKELSAKLGFPLVADVLSGRRDRDCLQHATFVLQHYRPRVAAVLHIGDRIVAKEILKYIDEQPLRFFGHIAEHPFREDPLSLHTHAYEGNPQIFVEALTRALPNSSVDHSWPAPTLPKFAQLSELAFMQLLASSIKPSYFVFFGNSMPIRDADFLFFPQERIDVYGVRGLSGIDGNIATIVGIALGAKKPGIAIFGDQTFLYDVSSLALLQQCPYPITIFVINNHGGGIFSFLPVAEKKEFLAPYFTTPQHYDLRASATMFGICYHKVTSLAECHKLLHSSRYEHTLVEIEVNIQENLQEHKDLHEYIKQAFLANLGQPV